MKIKKGLKNLNVFFHYVFIVSLFACKEIEKKNVVPLNSEINQIKELNEWNEKANIYRVILERCLKDFSGYMYLGNKGEELYVGFVNGQIDSTDFYNRIKELDEIVQRNDSLKKSVFIELSHSKRTIKVSGWKALSGYSSEEILYIEDEINQDSKIDLEEIEFDLVKIKRLEQGKKNDFEGKGVGRVYFSNISFFHKNIAFLYFEFVCGLKCGEGALVKLSKENDIWKMDDVHTIWEI